MTTINRIKKERDFVQMDKGFLHNPKMSAKAKGVLAYILSLPDDWVLYKSELPKHFSDGKDSIRSSLEELERFGHLVIDTGARDEKGKLTHHNITVYEVSIHGGFSATDKPRRVNRNGQPATTKNDSTKNDKPSVVQQAESTASSKMEIYKEILGYLLDKSGRSFKPTAEKNKKVINGRLSDGYTVDDFKRVIDWKVYQWQGTSNEMYLRPETLFGNKFEGYLNDANKNIHLIPQQPTIEPLHHTTNTQKEDDKEWNFTL